MSSPNDAVNQAIRLAITIMGGSAKAAATLGIKPQNFSHWTGDRGTRVATDHCVVIERETKGAVTRKDLRPDDWWAHWPELPGADRARRSAQKATA